jgi:hypothetical protein
VKALTPLIPSWLRVRSSSLGIAVAAVFWVAASISAKILARAAGIFGGAELAVEGFDAL